MPVFSASSSTNSAKASCHPSSALLLRILIFMHRALPQCLHVPELATGEGEGGEWLRGTSMRLLGHLIILSWLSFPAVFSVAALVLRRVEGLDGLSERSARPLRRVLEPCHSLRQCRRHRVRPIV